MRRTGPILIAVIGILALVIDFWPRLRLPDFAPGSNAQRTVETKLGLDLRGGLYVEYQVQPKDGESASQEDLGVIRTIVENRVNATGVAEPVVTTQGSDRIVIELPGVSDPNEVRALVGQTGRLDFVPLQAPCATSATEGQRLDLDVCKPLFAGDELDSAAVGQDGTTGQRVVTFRLKSEGARLFGEYTAANIGRNFAIVLDSEVISAPTIQSAITGGDVQITSGSAAGFPLSEAQRLVNVLNYGSLPFPIQEIRSDTLDPTLGAAFVNRSLLAGGIAIALVILYMLLHYRLPGLIAGGALIYYSLVVLAVFRLIPVTLTLAGIAGFVLSVGMAVDANILIFERTKEEMRLGKSLPTAIEAGFNRAWNSILDSNVSSLITALILYLFGSSVIRGFALVLIIGVLISMFTAISVTRTFLRIVVEREWARKARLYGVSESEFLARPTRRRPGIASEAESRV
jgi:preprotein translocase subunit SecD